MKYMNKKQCIEKEAIKNVIREMFLLRHLDHPYIVKLHYSFQGTFLHLHYFTIHRYSFFYIYLKKNY